MTSDPAAKDGGGHMSELESHDIAGWALRAAELELDRDYLRERVKELTDMLMAIQELPDQAQASAAKHLVDIALSKSPK